MAQVLDLSSVAHRFARDYESILNTLFPGRQIQVLPIRDRNRPLMHVTGVSFEEMTAKHSAFQRAVWEKMETGTPARQLISETFSALPPMQRPE